MFAVFKITFERLVQSKQFSWNRDIKMRAVLGARRVNGLIEAFVKRKVLYFPLKSQNKVLHGLSNITENTGKISLDIGHYMDIGRSRVF